MILPAAKIRRLMLSVLLFGLALTLLLTIPFRWLPPPTSAFILQAGFWGLGSAPPCIGIKRHWVDWESISPAVALAVIAAEDQLFPSHWGFDLSAIATALRERRLSGRIRGASTVSQQLAKNLYLWPDPTWYRKALEAWFTLALETSWSKRRILEVYLNTVQFDDCIFGVEAASRRFFRKSASQLSDREAALLASVLPNPVKFSADRPSSYTRERTEWILEQMRSLGGRGYLARLNMK